MSSYQSAEEPLGCAGVTPVLEKNVNDIAILIDGAPQVVLFTSDLDEDFIDKECVSIARVLAAQALGNPSPNLMHQRRIDSRLTVIPRSARRSSISLWLRLNRWYSQTA